MTPSIHRQPPLTVMEKFDVIVIGGGHAGAEAACDVMMKHEATIKAVLDEAGSL